jgi:hypothetical protein
MHEITETTVGWLDSTRVGVANIGQGPYQSEDGTTQHGTTAEIFLLIEAHNQPIVVGVGSVILIGDSRWRVVSVQKEGHELGEVAFDRC